MMWDELERESDANVMEYARKSIERRRRLKLWIRVGVVALILGTLSLGFMLVDLFGWGQ